MKVLLLRPPEITYAGSRPLSLALPLGLLYVAQALRKEGHTVRVFDALADPSRHIQGDGCTHHGTPWPALEDAIREIAPAVIGVSCQYTAQASMALHAACLAKAAHPQALCVLGGAHASVAAAAVLKECPAIDAVVVGEGEITATELLSRFGNCREPDFGGIPGLVWRQGTTIVANPRRPSILDLDALGFPAYDLVEMHRYFDRHNPALFTRGVPLPLEYAGQMLDMVTSRGCPFNCVFCSVHLHIGRKFRANSPGHVVAHIEHVIDTFGVRHIFFDDDNLTLDPCRFETILDLMIQKRLPITWSTPNGVCVRGLNERLLQKAKSSGCVGLTVGVESGSRRVLKEVIGKPVKLDEVVNLASLCRTVNLSLSAFFVVGLPGETRAEMAETLAFAKALARRYGVRPIFNAATPLLGTRLYEQCVKNDLLVSHLTPSALSEATGGAGKSLIVTDDFTPGDVQRVMQDIERFEARLRRWRQITHPWGAVKRLAAAPDKLTRGRRFLREMLGLPVEQVFWAGDGSWRIRRDTTVRRERQS